MSLASASPKPTSLLIHILAVLFLVRSVLTAGDDTEILLSQPHPLPLPPHCHLPNSTFPRGLYNHGHCPRTPCHTLFGVCSKTHGCCLDVWETQNQKLVCSEPPPTSVSIITSCRCQKCNEVHTIISGRVLSSHQRKPVSLAAVIINDEVTTFTNEQGHFIFEMSVSSKNLTKRFLIQEANHHPLEIRIQLTLGTHNFIVQMEHIATITEVETFNEKLSISLTAPISQQQDISASLNIPSSGFVISPFMHIYEGPGRILYSLYGGTPQFTNPALQEPIYKDSKGVEFAIFSLASGTLTILSEHGMKLSLNSGKLIYLYLSISTEFQLQEAEISKLHLFDYIEKEERWVDRGKVKVGSSVRNGEEGWYQNQLDIRLKLLPVLWTVGLPNRVTCYIGVSVNKINDKEYPYSVQLYMKQTGHLLAHTTSHNQQLAVTTGKRICLRAVCNLGGSLSVRDQHDHPYYPVSPNIQHGMVYGETGQLLFYCNSKEEIVPHSTTPFFSSFDNCINATISDTSQFLFLPPIHSIHPQPIPLTAHTTSPPHHSIHSRQCYVKIGVLACALETEVHMRVSSRGRLDKGFLVTETLYLPSGRHECKEDSVLHQLATCIQYPCDHNLLITAHYSYHNNQTTACIPWTFSPSLVHSTHTHSYAFLIQDDSNLHNKDTGLYAAVTETLALMRCLSGHPYHPSLTLDNTVGVAVTFTCRTT